MSDSNPPPSVQTETSSTGTYEHEGTVGATGYESPIPAGKFFLLEVPNYNLSQVEPTSYLRLGEDHPAEQALEPLAAAKAAEPILGVMPLGDPRLGTDLALKAVIKGLDVKGRDGGTEEGGYSLFEDDERDRGTHEHLSKEQRADKTRRFFKDVGWRDHTDGNRLTTTRGDKVEVIGGNYKLVVLGRQDRPIDGAGFDISGGDTRALSCIDAEVDSTEVTWKDGCWNVTEKVHAGKVYEYFRGKVKHEEIGKEGGSHDENPEITEITWAQNIDSRTVVEKAISEVVLASNIAETTNAVTITGTTTATSIADVTNAAVIQEVTNALVSVAEQVNAGSIEENVNCLGPINSMTVAVAINEQVNCAGIVTDNVNAGSIVEVTNAGVISETTLAGEIFDTKLTGASTEVFVGALKTDVTVAAVVEFFMGAKLDFALAAVLEIALTEKLVIGLEEHHLKGDMEISALDYTVDADGVVNIVGSNVSIGLGFEE